MRRNGPENRDDNSPLHATTLRSAFGEEALTLVKEALAFVKEALAFVGDPIAFVGDPVTSVGVGFALVGDPVPVVGGHVTFACGSVTLGRTECHAMPSESATGVGGQLAEKGSEASTGDCPDPFGSSELPAPPRCVRSPISVRALVGCGGAFLGHTVSHLQGELLPVGSSHVQILGGIQPLAHFRDFTLVWLGWRQP